MTIPGSHTTAMALAVWAFLTPAWVLGQAIFVTSVPTGAGPRGVAITEVRDGLTRVFAAVANSGESSVSLFQLGGGPQLVMPLPTIRDVPQPHAVAGCHQPTSGGAAYAPGMGARMLVTSPSANSVTIIDVEQGRRLGSISVGPQPFSADCYWEGEQLRGVVSNAGDDTLFVLDLLSMSVTARISCVPAARGPHGISVYRTQTGNHVAWVASPNAGVVTLVDLARGSVLARLPVAFPSAENVTTPILNS